MQDSTTPLCHFLTPDSLCGVLSQANSLCHHWLTPSLTGGEMRMEFTEFETGQTKYIHVSPSDFVHEAAAVVFPSEWKQTVSFGNDMVPPPEGCKKVHT